MPARWCANLMGAADESLEALLRDVLAEMGVELVVGPPQRPPDLVVACLSRGDSPVLTAAIGRCRPVIAVVGCADDLLPSSRNLQRIMVYRLGAPLEELRQLVRRALLGGTGATATGR